MRLNSVESPPNRLDRRSDVGSNRAGQVARARRMLFAIALGVSLAAPAVATETEYDPQEAGNPLRIAAYVVHPVGVVLVRLLLDEFS
jgi:hypothetical protein